MSCHDPYDGPSSRLLAQESKDTRIEKELLALRRVRDAAAAHLGCALSADESRLLMVGTNAPAMAREEGMPLHNRCDKIAETEDALRAALLLAEQEGERV